MNGQDLKLINFISKNFDVPLISLGGIGSIKDIRDSFEAGADAVAAGACLSWSAQSSFNNLSKN